MTRGTLAVLARPRGGEDAPEEASVRPIAAAGSPSDFGAEAEFAFGDFRLVPRSRLLLRNGRPVCLGSRAFDLLHALLRSPGLLVAKEALVKEVWPRTFVDESNLRFQMACLRKALGDERHFIKTVPGRGYVFTGECRRLDPRSEVETGRPAQLLPFPIGPSEIDPDDEARANPHGVWHLASLSIVRAASAGDAPLSAPQDRDGAEPLRVELLLPMLVLSGPWEASPGGRPQSNAATAIDLASLLELLHPALHRSGRASPRRGE